MNGAPAIEISPILESPLGIGKMMGKDEYKGCKQNK